MEENKDAEIKLNVAEETTQEQPKPAESSPEPQKPTTEPKKEEEKEIKLNFLKKAQFWQITSIVFIILFFVSLFFASPGGGISQEQAKNRVQSYVDTVIAGRAVATLGDVSESNDLYKIELNLEGQSVDSYITKDGKIFFPSGIDLDRFFDNPLPFTGGIVAGGINENAVLPIGASEDSTNDNSAIGNQPTKIVINVEDPDNPSE